MFRIDKRLIYHFDWVMLLLLVLVLGMGLLNLYSTTATGTGHLSPVFKKQVIIMAAGFFCIFCCLIFDYKEITFWGYGLYALILVLLAYTSFFVASIADTQRWINLGFFRLQPSEPAKLILVIVLARCFASLEHKKNGYGLLDLVKPGLLTIIPFVLIFIQPDLGTALMLAIIFVSMTLFAKIRWSTLAILSGAAMGVIYIGWTFLLKPYQKRRVLTLLNPGDDPMQHGYHVEQSKIAVGSGEIFGKGFMEGTQGHLQFLPERHTDFAFAIWAEEWGFAGSAIFLCCYFGLLLWGLHIALTARDKLGVMLAFGMVMIIFWQAVINLLMVMGLLPVVGIPLPLFSYGGSSLLTTMAAIGILMNIRMRRFQDS